MSTERPAAGPIDSTSYDVALLPDGATLVTRRGARSGLSLTSEEWRISGDCFEVRRSWLGISRVRRYRHGAVWLEHRRHRGSPRRALVLRAGGETYCLAVGDESPLRALGALIAERVGWRLRVSHTAPAPKATHALYPVATALLVVGLAMAVVGFVQARREAATVRALPPLTATAVNHLPLGTRALATGEVAGPAGVETDGFAICDASEGRIWSRYGMFWVPLEMPRLLFPLDQEKGSIPVTSHGALLAYPLHRATVGLRRYEGFRIGDTVTVLGTVALVDLEGRRGIAAQNIYGGTPSAFAGYVRRSGQTVGSIGVAAALVGALFLRTLWRVR